jgi:spermidine synthase
MSLLPYTNSRSLQLTDSNNIQDQAEAAMNKTETLYPKKSEIFLMMFLIGTFAQTGQILMFREVMALFHGTELLFGSLLGSWVIWISAGAAAVEFLFNRKWKYFSLKNPLKILVHSTIFNGFILSLQIIFLRFYPHLFSSSPIPQAFSFYGAITTIFLASFPFAFLMGAQFSLTLQINPKKSLGFLYRAESIGAMAGGMLTSFVLVEIATPLCIVFISGTLFILGFMLALRNINNQAVLSKKTQWIQTITACILIILAFLPLDRISQEMYRSKLSEGFSLKEVTESRYGRIEVLKNPQADQYLILHNGSQVSSFEIGSENRHEQHLAEICLSQHPDPSYVLLIGGVLSALPENILKHGIQELNLVELDPYLFQIFNTYSGSDLNLAIKDRINRLNIISRDGRSFVLSEPAQYYDLVIVFSPEPDNASVNRFCTREFFQQVKRILKSDGVFCLFLPTHGAAFEYLSEILINRTATIFQAKKSIFKNILAVPVNGHLLLGSQSENRLTIDPEVLGKRLSSRPDARPFYRFREKGNIRKEKIPDSELATYFAGLFGGVLGQRNFNSDIEKKNPGSRPFQNQLESSPVKMNLDSHPVAVSYSMMIRESISDPVRISTENNFLSMVFNILGKVKPLNIIIVPGVIVFFNFILMIFFISGNRRRQKQSCIYKIFKHYPICLAAFITGCFSITTEIVLLSLYQSLSGYLYYSVGILLAIFMGGLALGAKMTDRYLKNHLPYQYWKQMTVIIVLMILLCWITVSLPIHLSQLESTAVVTVLFVVFMLVNGILCGSVFPLLGFLTAGWNSHRPGAWIYALDLAGAGFGAFLIAPFLIPAAGIQNTLAILSVLLFSLLFLSIPLSLPHTYRLSIRNK